LKVEKFFYFVSLRARPPASPLVVFGVLLGLWLTEEGVDDLELFWGEDFAGAGVAGGLEGVHEGFVGMDFVGEAFACTLLAVVGEIGHGKVLLEHKLRHKIKD
jgi:hypothetical protein